MKSHKTQREVVVMEDNDDETGDMEMLRRIERERRELDEKGYVFLFLFLL